MQEPLVSVIVPVYDTEKYVRRAIESICNQTYKNIEIIVVNDGSPDNAEEECLKLAKEDARIKYYVQSNQGVSVARNLGIKKATGKYIMFCDSDDAWKQNLLETVVPYMEEKNFDMVRFGFQSMNPEIARSSALKEDEYVQRQAVIEYVSNNDLQNNLLICCGGIYKLSLINNNNLLFNTNLKYGEDATFITQYVNLCKKVKILEDQFYQYYLYFEGRVTATGRGIKVFYDDYELCCILFQEVYYKWNSLFDETEKSKCYGAFYDRLIGRLVRLAAYSSKHTRRTDYNNLKALLKRDYVIEAGKYYTRKRTTDSYLIPFLMKRRWTRLLWIVLRSKRKKYYQMYGRKKYVESIWKRDALTKV